MSTYELDDGLTDEQVDEAYAAHDEIVADRRTALREALTLLLRDGPDALLAEEGTLRRRMDNDGAEALARTVEVLHPKHRGVYWAREYEGVDA